MSSQVDVLTRVLRPVAANPLAPRLVAARSAAPARPRAVRRPGSETPIERALAVLRGPLRPLVVWGLFWGPRSFSELMRQVPDVTKRALRRELVEMERAGLVVRDVQPDSNRRASYALSTFGATLRPLVGAMYEWGLLCGRQRAHDGPRPDAQAG